MSNERASRDINRGLTMLAVTNDSNQNIVQVRVDPTTLRLLVGSSITSNALVAAPLIGQSKIAVSGTAVRLNSGTSQPLTNGIIISALSTNAASIEIGISGVTNTADGTGNGYILAAGASISFAVADTNELYINGTAGDVVSWAGS